ncbi:hypothetical protein [Streptomyces justiciae]|uniref:Uncharacterized protein n=1 Tax=Streptomyces justiciae TaxID=2780140 RepID=A0ABU3LMS7_9ACTN|nr:hypothetical protein [Streptomyces justiciae]MDT7840490.1 hypothetical protein [Streptomyces justiciae]
MIFGTQTGERFLDAVTGFETAVRGQDPDGAERAFQELHRSLGEAGPQETVQAAPRLAALLPEVPPGPRGVVAVIVGACVERGADPRPCAPYVFVELAETLAEIGEFCDRWQETGGGDHPHPDDSDAHPALFERVGPEAALAWLSLPQFEMACLALLNDPGVRTALDKSLRARLVRAVTAVEETTGHQFKCLKYALLVLDDEPLVVLHRPSGTGYRMRMGGIGDNFQLHTLLADVLVGGGHVPGRAPSPQEVAVCRDAPGQVHTVGSFNLMTPGGEWVWNEGTPSDIPVVDGVRLLVLDPPAYERSWPSGRFFPNMTGDLVLERVLDEAETRYWLGGCVPAT